jgi:putative addiction module component (TIGR02574 family)
MLAQVEKVAGPRTLDAAAVCLMQDFTNEPEDTGHRGLLARSHPKFLPGWRAKMGRLVLVPSAIPLSGGCMAQMSSDVSKLLAQARALSVEEQEALAESLISNLSGKVDEGVLAAWDEEIKKRIADLNSGEAKTIPWEEVRQRNLAKLPRAHWPLLVFPFSK